MSGRRGLPSTEGIYKQKQPGFSPQHPALRIRAGPSSSTPLKRSASLVLFQGGGDVNFGEKEYWDVDPGSRPGMLPPLGGQPMRRQPFMEEVPARLEGCRQRLAAADRAVSRAAALGGGSIAKAGQEAEIEMLQRQLDEVCKEDRILEPPLLKPAPSAPPSSAGYPFGEPAPEPSALSATCNVETTTASAYELVSADEALSAQADFEHQDLRAQLSTIEGQLLELDKKWRSAEQERREGEQARTDLAQKLQSSEASQQALQSKVEELQKLHKSDEAHERELEGDVGKLQAALQKLREDLGVSEGEAQALRSQVSELQSRETVLTTQINALHARVYAAESDAQAGRGSLDAVSKDNEELLGRLATLDAAHSDLAASHAEVCASHAKAEAARQDAEARHAAAEERHRLAELARAEAEEARGRAEAAHEETRREAEAIKEKEAWEATALAAATAQAANATSAEEVTAIVAEKERSIRERDALVEEKERNLQEKDALVKEASARLEDRERSHREVSSRLAEKEQHHAEAVAAVAALEAQHQEERRQRAAAERQAQDLMRTTQDLRDQLEAVRAEARAEGQAEGRAEGQASAAAAVASTEDEVEPVAAARAAPAVEVEMEPVAPMELSVQEHAVEDPAVVHYAPKCDVLLRATNAAGAKSGGLRPAQCQVDAVLQELRLLTLGPVGPPRIIPFADILDVVKGDDDNESEILVHWTAAKEQPAATVKLVPSDEQAAAMLVAALTIFDRTKPGSSLASPAATPGASTPRTPSNAAA